LHIDGQPVGDAVAMPQGTWCELRLVANEREGTSTWTATDNAGRQLGQWQGSTPAVRGARSVDRLRLQCEPASADSAYAHIFDDITVRRRVR
jgi:hypothetical protein